MRCIVQLDNQYHNDYIANAPSNYSSPLWIKNEEVNETKRHAKILSKQWRSSKNNTRAATTAVCPAGAAIDDDIIYDAVRCTEQGQSLRGLEHVTHQSIGRKRRLVKQTAIRAAVTEQRNQLVGHVLDTYYRAKDDEAVNGARYESRAAEDRSSGDVIKMDGKKNRRGVRGRGVGGVGLCAARGARGRRSRRRDTGGGFSRRKESDP